MKIDSVRGLCVIAAVMCAISLLVTNRPTSVYKKPSSLDVINQIEDETQRSELPLDLRRASVRDQKRLASLHQAIFIGNLLDGVAIIFFLLIFIKARESKAQPN